MADKELAAKLAQRLAVVGVPEEEVAAASDPPPVPVIPVKIVENPYVAVDNTVSIDDLILKTLERQNKEENNNVPAPRLISEASPSAVSPSAPSSTSPLSPPARTTIRDLLIKDHQHDPTQTQAQPKCPVVGIAHHKQPLTPIKRSSPEQDGSELERRLAAQRAKKTVVPEEPHQEEPEKIEATLSTVTVTESPKVECTLEREPVPPAAHTAEDVAVESVPTSPPPPQHDVNTSAAGNNAVVDAPALKAPSPINEESEVPEDKLRKSSFEELEEMFEKELRGEAVTETPAVQLKRGAVIETPAVKKEPSPTDIEATIQSLIPPSNKPEVSSSEGNELKETANRPKPMVPSPQLMEMIRTECGISSMKSPPPVPPPRPQSPVVKKCPLSPLGLMCDPNLSMESERSQPSPIPVQKVSPKAENQDELAALLERRNKIIEGETVPQFVNRKLSLYAEFSEFTRKQIKFFSDTFAKYDEDKDGFIDFNELKRMMEKLGEAQTHIALKQIIQKVDEDQDGKISLREFIIIFRLAAEGHFACSEVFTQLANSVDVTKEGVLGAASFFQAKIAEQSKLSKFEEEIKQEQDERKKEEEEKKQRREKFLQSKSLFH